MTSAALSVLVKTLFTLPPNGSCAVETIIVIIIILSLYRFF